MKLGGNNEEGITENCEERIRKSWEERVRKVGKDKIEELWCLEEKPKCGLHNQHSE